MRTLMICSGDVTSFEVCPSKVRVTRRLSYTELDDMLAREETSGRILESLLTDSPIVPTPALGGNVAGADSSVDSALPSTPSLGLGEGRMTRSNLGKRQLLFFSGFIFVCDLSFLCIR